MPSPKSGKAGSAVEPVEPKAPQEADKADPGEVDKIKAEQKQKKSGKYGSAQVKPHKPPETKEEKKKKPTWIEIELVNEKKKPIPGEPYKVVLADGQTVAEGTLNEKGFARVDGIEPGTCTVVFPRRDKSCWKKVG
jgi:hypothetical protein